MKRIKINYTKKILERGQTYLSDEQKKLIMETGKIVMFV